MSPRHRTVELAEFVQNFDIGSAPRNVIDRTVRLFADAVACGIGAGQIRWGQDIQRAASALGGGTRRIDGPVLLAGGAAGEVVPTAGMNALLINCLDYDDTHFGHPGAVIVPVALALGHVVGSSRRDLIEAVTVGYEVAGRVAAASNPSPSARDAAWGTGLRFAPAAAAVAGKLLGLDRTRLAHALALAACDGPVPSVRQTVYSDGGPSMAKNNYAASVTAGVTAAFLAREGIAGPLDLFDGADGFAALTGTDRWRPDELISDQVHALQVDSKPYACCRKIHASLDALRELRSRHGFSPDDVLEVLLVSPGWSAGRCFANPRPRQAVDVQFSAAFCSALLMHDVPTGIEWFNPALLSDEPLLATAGRVQVKVPPEARTRSFFWTQVQVRTTSGVYECEVSNPKGSALNSMTDEELRAKFTGLVAPVLGPDRSVCLYDALVDGHGEVDARGLSALISGDGRRAG
jgi:2-methylcitrate dehydratase PrpD